MIQPVYTRLLITDGRRDLCDRTISTFDFYCTATPAHTLVVDDSADASYTVWLTNRLPDALVVAHPERAGLAAAIRTAWANLPVDTTYVIHLEDDFEFIAPIDLSAWTAPLRADPNIANVVLQRGPNNPREHEHGGILRSWAADGVTYTRHDGYITHQHLFSLQPNIYRRELTDVGWPEHGGEREFTDQLLRDAPSTLFAYLGGLDTPPPYIHLGYGRRMPEWQL